MESIKGLVESKKDLMGSIKDLMAGNIGLTVYTVLAGTLNTQIKRTITGNKTNTVNNNNKVYFQSTLHDS